MMPIRSRNGRDLFYRTDDQRLMVVRYRVETGTFAAEQARTWPGEPLANTGLASNFDLAPEGERLIVLMPAESPERRGLNARELTLRVRVGEPPMQAIVSATKISARVMGWEDRIGTVEAGKFADLIAVEHDPLEDISTPRARGVGHEGRSGLSG